MPLWLLILVNRSYNLLLSFIFFFKLNCLIRTIWPKLAHSLPHPLLSLQVIQLFSHFPCPQSGTSHISKEPCLLSSKNCIYKSELGVWCDSYDRHRRVCINRCRQMHTSTSIFISVHPYLVFSLHLYLFPTPQGFFQLCSFFISNSFLQQGKLHIIQ